MLISEQANALSSGRLTLGCNYWASHAGTAMWSDWQPDVVERDLAILASHGMRVLRVFPLWSDFQPIRLLYGGQGRPVEVRMGEARLPDTEVGRSGLSEMMLARFAEFATLSEKHGLSLVVGLLTGWMSGRLFVPPAMDGRNVLRDPFCLVWSARFIRAFVSRFKATPAVMAWDLGNECNCMGSVECREDACLWTATMAGAVKRADPSRPLISGMHGLSPEGPWTMQDQGEFCDLLTTHPYPLWTRHCDLDPVDSMRAILHSACETRFYEDLGGKPCFIEETGTMGPAVIAEERAAGFARACMVSALAHDAKGYLWWCSSDQTHLAHAPYDWVAVERELGLMDLAGRPKPVLQAYAAMDKRLRALPLPVLPVFQADACCVLTEGQDAWGAAFGSFMLAKQAGFDLRFAYHDQPLPESKFYLCPSLGGNNVMSREHWRRLKARVEEGAVLFCSVGDGVIAEFEALTGLHLVARSTRTAPSAVTMTDDPARPPLLLSGSKRHAVEPLGAEVLACEADGNPAFARNRLGKGWVYTLLFPLELDLVQRPGVFDRPLLAGNDYWRLYARVADRCGFGRAVAKRHPLLGLTEHRVSPHRRLVLALNHDPGPIADVLTLAPGWTLGEVYMGTVDARQAPAVRLELPGIDAVLFAVQKEGGE